MQQSNLMHTFIYDLLFSAKITKKLFSIILLIARIWPECLFIKPNTTTNTNPILRVIIYVTRIHLINAKAGSTQELFVFERLCNWNMQSMNRASDLYSSLNARLCASKSLFIYNPFEFKLNDTAFQCLNAFKLLCKHEGWDWSLNVFIMQYIKDHLEKWTLKQQEADCNDDLTSFYLILQSHLLAHMCPLSEVTLYVVDCIKSFSFFIKKSNLKMSSHFIQLAIIDCLLLLVPYDPCLCFNEIQIWFKLRCTQVPLELKTRLKLVYDSYKCKLPDSILIKF